MRMFARPAALSSPATTNESPKVFSGILRISALCRNAFNESPKVFSGILRISALCRNAFNESPKGFH